MIWMILKSIVFYSLFISMIFATCINYSSHSNTIYQKSVVDLSNQTNFSKTCINGCVLVNAVIWGIEGNERIYSGDSFSYQIYLTKLKKVGHLSLTISITDPDGNIYSNRTYNDICLDENKTTVITPFQQDNSTYDIFSVSKAGTYEIKINTNDSNYNFFRYYPKTTRFTFHNSEEKFYFEAMPKWQSEYTKNQIDILNQISNATDTTSKLIQEQKTSNFYAGILTKVTVILTILGVLLAIKPEYEKKAALLREVDDELGQLAITIIGIEKIARTDENKLIVPDQELHLKSLYYYKANVANKEIREAMHDLLIDMQTYNNILKKYLSWNLYLEKNQESNFQLDRQLMIRFNKILMDKKTTIHLIWKEINKQKNNTELNWNIIVGSLFFLAICTALLPF